MQPVHCHSIKDLKRSVKNLLLELLIQWLKPGTSICSSIGASAGKAVGAIGGTVTGSVGGNYIEDKLTSKVN